MDSSQLWERVLGELSVEVSPVNYAMFLKPCRVKGVVEMTPEKTLVELVTTSAIHAKTFDEKYYLNAKRIMEKVLGKNVELAVSVQAVAKEEKPEPKKQSSEVFNELPEPPASLFAPPEVKEGSKDSNLNPKYLFDTYIVGKTNQLAFAVAKSVAETPGTRHNPFFIYGGVGVGKTHLMHAVGHELVKKGVGKVMYVTSENFTNDLIGSFKTKMTDAFKKKYRNVGALLIDDVQFFGGKEQTQEEFFHTFNELTGKQVQIIMTSDRKPQEIVGLEDRLKSRFLGGMLVDIGLPDYEMRIAILRQQAEEIGLIYEDGVLEMIAEARDTNARELGGNFATVAMKSVYEKKTLTKEDIQIEMGMPKDMTKTIKIRPVQIISTTAKYFGFRNKDLTGPSRKADLVLARHIAMFLIRDLNGVATTKLGEMFGGRDHTTIMHACEKMEKELIENQDLQKKINAVRKGLFL